MKTVTTFGENHHVGMESCDIREIWLALHSKVKGSLVRDSFSLPEQGGDDPLEPLERELYDTLTKLITQGAIYTP